MLELNINMQDGLSLLTLFARLHESLYDKKPLLNQHFMQPSTLDHSDLLYPSILEEVKTYMKTKSFSTQFGQIVFSISQKVNDKLVAELNVLPKTDRLTQDY